MKLVSWNVNGLRACVNKGFLDFFKDVDADVFCIQETKMQPEQLTLDLPGYHQFWYSAVKKGYSGTAIFSKKEPLSVSYGLGMEIHDQEGRAITLEYENCYVVNTYVPNSKEGLARIDYRIQWEDDLRNYLLKLNLKKPVIWTGDLNVARNEIDLKNPKSNRGSAGFSDQERGKMEELLNSGFTDSFRHLYPERVSYTWWSYMFHSREKNVGWRIDYFITSQSISDKIKDSLIYETVLGSDHCPVGLEIDID